MSKLGLNDFNKICRLCLNEDSTLINIFFSDSAEIISEITSTRLTEGDSLPENICIPCMDKSSEFYEFKQFCKRSNITLQSILALGNTVDNTFYNLDNSETIKLNTGNNEISNAGIEINENINKFGTNRPNLTQEKPELLFNSLDTDINITNYKAEIKSSYNDLIPLDTYNNQQCLKTEPQTVLLEETDPSQDNVDKVEVPSENIYHNESGTELKSATEFEEMELQDGIKNCWCEHCHVKFDDIKIHLKEYHLLADGMHYCYICSKSTSSVYKTVKQLQAHLKYHRQLPKFQCEVCNKWFRYKQQRMVHMRIHTGERPAVCSLCNKSFRDSRYLDVHLKSHSGEKPYKCSLCEKGFGHKFTLKVHMKTHSTEREHMCSICGKTFIYRHNLKIHLRQHTGEKPYGCHLCFASFISGSVLRAHMLTHSDQKRFECKVCNKKFKRTGDLNVHMRSHTGEKPYACTLCDNKYKMSSHLTEHMKTHTGEKNYVCEICSKPFYNNKSLQVHKNTHLGQKTYSCQHCDKCFVHHTSLCAHQRKQHRK